MDAANKKNFSNAEEREGLREQRLAGAVARLRYKMERCTTLADVSSFADIELLCVAADRREGEQVPPREPERRVPDEDFRQTVYDAESTALTSTPREPHLPTIETSSATDYLPPSFTAAAPAPVPPRLRCAACGKWFTVASPQREQEEIVTAIENWQGDAVSQCRIDASISDLAPAPVKDAPRGDRWVDIHTGKEISDTAKDAPQFPPEVIAGIEEGRAAVRRGETIPWEQVRGTGSDARGRAACQTQAVPNPAAPREAQLAQMCETFVDEFCGGSETVMGILMTRILGSLSADRQETPREDEREACWEDVIHVIDNAIKDSPGSFDLKALREAIWLQGWKEFGTGDGKPMHNRPGSNVSKWRAEFAAAPDTPSEGRK